MDTLVQKMPGSICGGLQDGLQEKEGAFNTIASQLRRHEHIYACRVKLRRHMIASLCQSHFSINRRAEQNVWDHSKNRPCRQYTGKLRKFTVSEDNVNEKALNDFTVQFQQCSKTLAHAHRNTQTSTHTNKHTQVYP